MDYTIQVDRVEASIVDRSGKASAATFFVHTVSPHQFATETVADRLNEPDVGFIPCEVAGRTELVRLNSISYVEIHGPAPEIKRLEEIGAARTAVQVEMDCGESLDGELVYESPPTTDRVSDLLNSRGDRFLLLACQDRTLFVRRDAITRVRP